MSIRINDLTVRFKNGVVAVNKASLEIPKGIYGLLGENGAGKTTLMRVLTTVLKQTEGMVSLDGILYNEIMRKYRKRLVIFHRKSTYIRILR
jgi:ABC-2 type transport system ATP-binding protein